MPTQYKFTYTVDLKIRGHIFPTKGIITGIHARHAESKVLKKFPGTKPIVKPYFNGKCGGSDLTFGSIAKKGRKFNDRVN